jgi:hypothetical protein
VLGASQVVCGDNSKSTFCRFSFWSWSYVHVFDPENKAQLMFCELRELQCTRGTFFERQNVASVQQKVIYFEAATNLTYKTLGINPMHCSLCLKSGYYVRKTEKKIFERKFKSLFEF